MKTTFKINSNGLPIKAPKNESTRKEIIRELIEVSKKRCSENLSNIPFKIQYKIFASFDLNKVFSSVDSIVDKLNDKMESFGFQEKLILRSENVEVAVLTSDRLLLKEEIQKIVSLYEENFAVTFPNSNPKIEIVESN